MELFTFESLSSLAGASLVVYLIVQYTKNLISPKIPTDIYAAVMGSLVLVLAQLAEGASVQDWRIYVLSIFNGFVVAATAGKINDTAIKPPKMKDRYEGEA